MRVGQSTHLEGEKVGRTKESSTNGGSDPVDVGSCCPGKDE